MCLLTRGKKHSIGANVIVIRGLNRVAPIYYILLILSPNGIYVIVRV
jgi:hypothetical protein